MTFVWDERELNGEQTEAVLAPDSVFLVACPGSGKTRTLTYKLAFELSQLSGDKRFVVAITYTHRAADEIQERVEALGVNTSRLWIGTIHAFCLEWILKPYHIYEPALAHGYRILDQHERQTLLEEFCAPRGAPRITHYDCDYYFLPEGGYRLGCQDERKHARVHAILAQYFAHLREHRQLDFELLLAYAHHLVEKVPTISQLLSNVFSIVLVDEYQDTKDIQYSILGSILRTGAGRTRLFMVGDPNQAIYGSLGGYAIEITELRQLTGLRIDAKSLARNYRSSKRLITYFGNYNVHNTQIEAAGRLREYVSLVTYDHAIEKDALVDEIASLIRHNVEHLGVAPNEICVLAPQWVHVAAMTRRLVTALPNYQFDGPGMMPFARDTENFWFKVARLALTEPAPDVYVRRMKWAAEILRELRSVDVSVSLAPKDVLRMCNAITLAEEDGLAYLKSFFAALFDRLQISLQHVQTLQQLHVAFFASSAARMQQLQEQGLADVGELAFFKKTFQNRSGITVSTIHGVKGAEFDTVIAYALLQGMVPHFSDPNGDVSARKLLYVIGSRARKNLHLFSESGRARGRFGAYEPTEALFSVHYGYDQV